MPETMDVAKCPNCALPFESSNYYLRGMNIKCRSCGYSGLPLSAGACFYDRLKFNDEPHDPFKGFLGAESLSSKIALIFLFGSLVSAWSLDLRQITVIFFAGFLIFSAMFGLLRLRSS